MQSSPTNNMRLKCVQLHDDAQLPSKANETDAGFDVSCVEDITVKVTQVNGKPTIIPLGITARAPEGTYIRVAPRSGLAAKHALDVGAGVVDIGYSGEIGVVMFNFGNKDFEFKKGDRVAQLILEKIDDRINTAEWVDGLPDSTRGSNGFGSTQGFCSQ